MKLQATIAAFISVIAVQSLKSQDSTNARIREYYISIANLSPVNIHLKYKKQIGANQFFKVGLVSLSANFSESYNNDAGLFAYTSDNYSGGVSIGLEFRKVISKKFTFFHGPNLTGIYRFAVNTNPNLYSTLVPYRAESNSVSILLPYTFGLLFHIRDNFYAAAEINPMVYVNYSESTMSAGTLSQVPAKQSNLSGGFGFDNQYGLVSLVYRR
jgi:hypothetical protein